MAVAPRRLRGLAWRATDRLDRLRSGSARLPFRRARPVDRVRLLWPGRPRPLWACAAFRAYSDHEPDDLAGSSGGRWITRGVRYFIAAERGTAVGFLWGGRA